MHADERLDDFVAAFDNLSENRTRFRDWTRPGAPWAPYLEGQFTSSLTAQERRRYLNAQDAGDCDVVAELERIGFLRLNPVLRPAFERADVRTVFADEITRFHSYGSSRCRALNLYREGLQRLKQSGATIRPIDVPRLRRKGLGQWPPAPRASWMPEHRRARGLYYLTNLALCREYLPAIKDVLGFISAPRVLFLSDEEDFYLASRARQLDTSKNLPRIGCDLIHCA